MKKEHISIALILMIIIASIGIGSIIFSQEEKIILYISNQSEEINPANISVFIDGELKVHDEYYVKNNHNWIKYNFTVSFGRHEIKAVSDNGSFKSQKNFWSTSKRWIVIDHYTDHLRLDITDSQPKFM